MMITVRFGMSDIVVLEKHSDNDSWQQVDVSRWNLPDFNFSFDWNPLKRRSTRSTPAEYAPAKGLRKSDSTESTEISSSAEARKFAPTTDIVIPKRKVSSPLPADLSLSKRGKKE